MDGLTVNGRMISGCVDGEWIDHGFRASLSIHPSIYPSIHPLIIHIQSAIHPHPSIFHDKQELHMTHMKTISLQIISISSNHANHKKLWCVHVSFRILWIAILRPMYPLLVYHNSVEAHIVAWLLGNTLKHYLPMPLSNSSWNCTLKCVRLFSIGFVYHGTYCCVGLISSKTPLKQKGLSRSEPLQM